MHGLETTKALNAERVARVFIRRKREHGEPLARATVLNELRHDDTEDVETLWSATVDRLIRERP